MRCRPFLLLLTAALCIGAGRARPPDPNRLLYHVETLDGAVLSTQGTDVLFNPASVIKVATSMWALDRLGADHRYETVVGYRGSWDPESGVVDGQLVLDGRGDPDFHPENLFLMAGALEQLGVTRITGGLVITGHFTVGWEHGAEGRMANPEQRALAMAYRARAAVDRTRWQPTHRAAWRELCARHGWDPTTPPSVRLLGPAAVAAEVEYTPLLRHLSNPLEFILKRFNAYSNNDIIRVAEGLGGVEGLERFLEQRLGAGPGEVQLETASGELTNRLTPRLVVQLLRAMHATLADHALAPHDVLPVPGCDDAPVSRMFPALTRPPLGRTAAVKTGTLRFTDGGVAALAGYFASPERGLILFCVAAPRAGSRIQSWRAMEQQWLVGLIAELGGASPDDCGPELLSSDDLAMVGLASDADPEVASRLSAVSLQLPHRNHAWATQLSPRGVGAASTR